MGKLSIFIFVVFLAVLALFAIDNQEVTTITIPWPVQDVYEIPKMALILLAIAVGFVTTLFVFMVKSTGSLFQGSQLAPCP
jgi:uncharacterized integral membrane protein